MFEQLTLNEIAHVIALATAPAFLIAGTVSFLAILLARIARVMDRARALDEISDSDERRARLKADMPGLRHRARMLHTAMLLTILSGSTTALVMVIAFIGALVGSNFEISIAVLFVLSLVLFAAALWLLAHDGMIALGEFRHYF